MRLRGSIIVFAMLFGLFMFSGCSSYGDLKEGLYAEISTSKGNIIVSLEFKKAPMTVMNFVGLAEGTIQASTKPGARFFDGLVFHRVIADFMIQGGDPLGNGTGGPGYKFPDEITDLKHDRAGTLSMANSGPNTNGSQFFITHKDTPWLDSKHTVFGYVVQGQEIVGKIAQGDAIKKVTIIRKGKEAQVFAVSQDTFNESVKNAYKKSLDDKLAIINKKWPAAISANSGLKYIVLKEGLGLKPRMGSQVTVHYTGSLLDGTEFDSSIKRGKPAQFKIGGLIKGFDEALLDMKKGEKRTLIIPPELGYGDNGVPGTIPGGAFLVFEVQLIDFSN